MNSQPWKTPRVRDVCERPAGKRSRLLRREVIEVREAWGSSSMYVVVYRNEHGILADCWCETWESWCARAVRAGGSYRRAEGEQ